MATARPATGSKANGKTVMEMPDPKQAGAEAGSFLKVFGQSNRDDMPKKTPPSSLQAMLLMQSKIVTDRVLAMNGSRLEKLLGEQLTDGELVDRLFLDRKSVV